MSASRLVLFCLFVVSGGLHAQGPSSDEVQRQEDAAVAHARKMKSIKEQAVNEPLPQDLGSNQGAVPAVTVSSAQLEPPAEAFSFQVVTPQGLVPLEEWQQPQGPAPVPVPAPVPPSTPIRQSSSPRSLRLARFQLEGREPSPVEGRALPLPGAPKKAEPVAAPAAPESIAPDVKKTKPNAKPVPKVEVAPAEQGSTVIAVMEDEPASQPGGEPKRRLLGFLSGKGMDAALGKAAAGSQAENKRIEQTKPTAAAASLGKPEAPLVAQKPLEEASRKEPLPSGREDILNGIGQWLASTKKEPFKPAAVAPKFTDAGVPKPVGDQPATAPADSTNLDYVAIKARAPFHVIDTGDGSTQLLELDSGTVGRKHGEGDEWTWMQLDSGLMGLMKKRFVRPAVPGEVVAFLAAEAKSSGTALAQAERSPVRFVQVDLTEESADQAMASGLDGGSRPGVIPEIDSPSAVTLEPAQPEALVKIPEPPPISSIVPPLPQHPLVGGVAAGVIAVPSPVPILP
jgi:hypothetical protein